MEENNSDIENYRREQKAKYSVMDYDTLTHVFGDQYCLLEKH